MPKEKCLSNRCCLYLKCSRPTASTDTALSTTISKWVCILWRIASPSFKISGLSNLLLAYHSCTWEECSSLTNLAIYSPSTWVSCVVLSTQTTCRWTFPVKLCSNTSCWKLLKKSWFAKHWTCLRNWIRKRTRSSGRNIRRSECSKHDLFVLCGKPV